MLTFFMATNKSENSLYTFKILTDFYASDSDVSCDFDIVDGRHANTVRKLDFVSIGKFDFKHIAGELQHNLEEKTYFAIESSNCLFVVIIHFKNSFNTSQQISD